MKRSRLLAFPIFVFSLAFGAASVPLPAQAAAPAPAENQPPTIPFDQLGSEAQKQYSGDGIGIAPTAEGARLRAAFQKLQAEATPEGLWIESTERPGSSGRFRVKASVIGRTGGSAADVSLPALGIVHTARDSAVFVRPGLIEEYRVSLDGVRQDFIVSQRPAGRAELCLALEINGAQVETAAYGAKLTLAGSRREIAYSRLHVTDATGKKLPARMEAAAPNRLALLVDDSAATYPLRIDPTFSDADWIGMGETPGTNGVVRALAVSAAGDLYIGGAFTLAGTEAVSNIAKWNGSAWSALEGGVNDEVNALAVSGTNIYAGGAFTTAGGAAAGHVARWNGSAWSAVGSGFNGDVLALLVSGSNIYAGGDFFRAGETAVNYIARWNGTAWRPLGIGMTGTVRALAITGSTLYAGGVFSEAGGTLVNCLAKWDGSAWEGITPTTGEAITGTNSAVNSLVVAGPLLYIGGDFSQAGGVVVNYLAVWDGARFYPLGEGVNNNIRSVVVSGVNVYVGGQFTEVSGAQMYGIAKWNGTSWNALGEGVETGRVDAMAMAGTDLFVSGSFPTVDGLTANNVARWNGSGWYAVGSRLNGTVRALAVTGTDVYAAGSFTTAGRVPANRVAKWDGSTWSALSSGMNGTVHALALSGATLYAGGEFTTAGGLAASRVARWDGTAWSAMDTGASGTVHALAALGSAVYAAGAFADVVRWDDGHWASVGQVDGTVRALSLNAAGLYAGGDFTVVSGVPAAHVANFDGQLWHPLGAGTDGSVRALRFLGADLYAGGDFTLAGGQAAGHVARWNGQSWSALGAGISGPVHALSSIGGDLFAGGDFTLAGAGAARRIAKWDGSAWSPLGSGANAPVHALAPSSTDLFVGGDFTRVGTQVSAFVAHAMIRQPEVIQGNGVEIVSGDLTPNLADHTDFGGAKVIGETVARTFTILNTGDHPLQLTGSPQVAIGGLNPTDFAVTAQPESSLAAGASTTFQLTFDPTVSQTRSATVTLFVNGVAHRPSIFGIQGTGLEGAGQGADIKKPVIKLTKPSFKIVSSAQLLAISGTVSDDVAVDRVEARINNGQPVRAALARGPLATSLHQFSAQIPPALEAVNVLTVTAYDTNGSQASTTYTFARHFRLTLTRAVPPAAAQAPDKAGTLAIAATPSSSATALTKGPAPQTATAAPGTVIKITATAKTDHTFSHWTGLPEGSTILGNVAVLTMPQADLPGVTAVFIANPFAVFGAKPSFQGLLLPAGPTPHSNASVGLLTGTLVPASGVLTGKILMDGKSTSFTATLLGDGSVWFKGKTLTSTFIFLGRTLSMSWTSEGLAATVTAAAEVSSGIAKPSRYSATAPATASLLNRAGKQGYFTVSLPSRIQATEMAASTYPQGAGWFTITLEKAGTLKLAGVLADGTSITASSALVAGDNAPIFVQNTTPGASSSVKGGSFLGTLVFDTARTQSDVTGTGMMWFRPAVEQKTGTSAADLATQLYTGGWPAGILVSASGARYDSNMPAQTALGLPTTSEPTISNATLFFRDGLLPPPGTLDLKHFNITANKVTVLLLPGKPLTLTLTSATGFFKGTFPPGWTQAAKTQPVFQGVIVQKGIQASGRGFFLSNRLNDLNPESGRVTLDAPVP